MHTHVVAVIHIKELALAIDVDAVAVPKQETSDTPHSKHLPALFTRTRAPQNNAAPKRKAVVTLH